MRRQLPLVLGILLVVVGSCALPADERATRYNADDLPPDIANTTTTTTTTTTIVPTTQPSTEVSTDPGGTTTSTTTTTQAPTLTAPVDLYYTVGFSDDVAQVRRDLQVDAPLPLVLAQLEQPLPDVADFGLRTEVQRGMIEDVNVERGVATVVLDRTTVDAMPDPTRRRAIAQLVLTITSFRVPGAGAVGRVRFESDGEGYAVFVPADGGSSEPGEELAFDDFASLIAGSSAAATTTTPVPDTTTPSAEPPSSDPETTAG